MKKKDFSKYFSASRFSRLPLHKVVVALACVFALVVSTGTGIAFTAVNAMAPGPEAMPSPTPGITATPEPSATPQPSATPAPEAPVTMEVAVVQQSLGIEVFVPQYAPAGEEQEGEESGEPQLIPVLGVPFTVLVTDKNDKQTEYQIDPTTGTLLIEELEPGDYTVALAPYEGYVTPEAQKVTVEKKKVYQVDTEAIKDEIVKSDEVNESTEDQEYGNTGSPGGGTSTPLQDTVQYAPSSSKVVDVTARAYPASGVPSGGYVPFADGTPSPYKAVLDPTGTYIVRLEVDIARAKELYGENGFTVVDSLAAQASQTGVRFLGSPWGGVTLLGEENSGPSSTEAPDATQEPTAQPSPASTEAPPATPQPTQEPTPVPTATPEPTAEPTPVPSPTQEPTASPSPSPQPSPTASPQVVRLQKQYTLFDEAGKTIVETSAFALKAADNVKVGTTTLYTGWQKFGDKQYYYNPADNKPVTGTQIIGGQMYTFSVDGVLGMTSKGIDVSKYQGKIDWNQVKASGIDFAIIRVGYRGYGSGALVEDDRFRENIQGATAAGLKVGLYFYTQAINEEEAVKEASMVLSLCKGYNITYPIFFDTEKVAGATGRADNISRAQRTANAVAFCNAIQSAGYTAGVYSYRDWFYYNLNFASIQNYKIWIAQYRSTLDFNYRYDIWQYSSTGKVPGISANVDMNIGY